MLNFIAQQAWKYPMVHSSIVLRLISKSAKTLVNNQSTQTKKYYTRSWYSIIYHYYSNMTSHNEAKSFVYHFPRIKTVSVLQLDETLSILQSQGFSWDEVKEHKDILLLQPGHLRERIQVLRDLSIVKPTLPQVSYVSELMHYSVRVLRDNGVFSQSFDVVGHLLNIAKVFQLPEGEQDQFLQKYRGDENCSLKDLHVFLLKHFLALRFAKDIQEVEMLFENNWLPVWKSLGSYICICDVIVASLKFDFSTVLANKFVLNLDPEKVKGLLENYPYIGKSTAVDVIKAFPSLLLIPVLNIERWINLLEKYQVTKFEFNAAALRLFKINTFKDAEERLQVLSRLPEWPIICLSEHLFFILRNSKSVKRILNAAEAGQLASLTAILDTRICGNINRLRKAPLESCSYVAEELNIHQDEVKELLTGIQFIHFGMANIKMVLKLLFDFGFTREQIINGIMILNFEQDLVKQGLQGFPTRPEAQPFDEWMENPFVLHLLAYCIKKDVPNVDLPIRR
ncbi:uncharacterized protein [Procambarus clarkii]|uniref:uncharacterized protein isoform X1 n=1 Tax=Procambarus clarkii TaxID=6728 RepID=UPI003742B85A